MQVVMEYLIYPFLLFLLLVQAPYIQLWGLCIFLYCYYGRDNNLTDMIVFSLIQANKKDRREECW